MSRYNDFVQDHYRHPRNLGRLRNATVKKQTFRDDAMLEFHLRLTPSHESIELATFRAIGCAGTVAAGSAMTEWLAGRAISEAQNVNDETVLSVLQGLPEERLYCAEFAAEAIQQVISELNLKNQ